MLSMLVWVFGLLLRVVILARGVQTKTLLKYSYFFGYVFSSCATDVSVYAVWVIHRAAYEKTYWGLQFVTLMIGCGIMLEIFRHVLAPYAGAEKFATVVALATFGAIFSFGLLYQFFEPNWSAAKGTAIELERDVRTVQALFLFGIFAVISYYQIPLGKNLKGMILGYGLYIVTSLMTLATRSYAGASFNHTWSVIQPRSYNVVSLIWAIALWSYHPNPVPDPAIHLEEDYEALAARTKRTLVAMRSHVIRATTRS